MKVGSEGCALCGSTWGEIWSELDGERFFFCCELCARQFRSIVQKVKDQTGWDRLDALEIVGDRRGRTCAARRGEERYRCFVGFNPAGELTRFREFSAERRPGSHSGFGPQPPSP